ncbi:scavenger mRNA-decappiing enzyme, putative [Bodo saltans]|uniref:Scavenger mRNA-decappiing enzyme, putative n=1 Tax=Bodo saltans TaxID=75058 RepID=A0A0S4JGA0_BODSA|nr:scavenger mRNA-decappiing enzyme, putative [Bodo saltans]|eukprot:CUG89344.1 scavenger mRNA-decappiing enzyme, putative [Bodo saltans]
MRPAPARGSFPATRLPQLTNLVKSFSAHRTGQEKSSTHFVHDYPKNIDPPGTVTPQLLAISSQTILVNDAYPKATVHMLVLPRDTKVQSLNDLNSNHVDLLLDMKKTANDYISWSGSNGSPSSLASSSPSTSSVWTTRPFAMGFHAIPSLPMLHMHVMTLDLHRSPRVKKRAHYNSFATRFFLPVDEVIEDVKRNGFVTINQDVEALHQYEGQPYVCLWCGSNAFSLLPALKEHIKECKHRKCGAP